ncbi:DUF2501 domain-containing protein [Variovorax sp. RT4R15]|uniref:DUF2501 domain-containing protein n=1 Tax=Variovorax sp. RT4R15 TaxID=3443737 RepID=UPI003F48F0FA
MNIRTTLSALALLTAGTSWTAHADLLGDLKTQAGNYAMPAVGADTIGNAAGVLQYCVKNNYLGGDAASVKDKLLSKITGQKQQQAGYANGAKGLLQGGDGKSLNLKAVSGKLKTKACDYVLKNASSLV